MTMRKRRTIIEVARSGAKGEPGQRGQPGQMGQPGTPGTNGINGTDGQSAIISSVSAQSGPAGTQASVSVGGTQFNRTFQFTIPQGQRGESGEGQAVIGDGSINFELHGGGAEIPVGIFSFVRLNFDATFTGWQVFSGVAGSISCSITKHTFAQGPLSGTAIHGSAKPMLSSSVKNQNTAWSASAVKGETIKINVDSVTGLQDVYISLFYERTI